MFTRCPYPECLAEFECQDGGRVAYCHSCGNAFTAKPLDVWRQIDRQANVQAQRSRLLTAASLPADLPALTVMLDDIRSLWNVGSIFRTADGAGCGLLVACGITAVPPRKEIAKTSLGAEDAVAWLYARSPVEAIPLLRKRAATVMALEYTRHADGINASIPLSDVLKQQRLSRPLVMVVGNEVSGVSRETLGCCDIICHLPMRGTKESLNVAVAFGIAAYALGER
jgi:tRNA G18 (ribose-2'-O)-methylase SpoU